MHCGTKPTFKGKLQLPDNSGLVSLIVGKTFSLADKDTKKENGTIQRHSVK